VVNVTLRPLYLGKEILHQTLYYPTNAHNVRNVELLKHIEIKEAAPTRFGLQGNHHQGDTASEVNPVSFEVKTAWVPWPFWTRLDIRHLSHRFTNSDLSS